MSGNEGIARPVSLDGLGQRYRRYRLADPEAEEAMAGSLRRWGQLAPVVACVRAEQLELIDGFKRLAWWSGFALGFSAGDAFRHRRPQECSRHRSHGITTFWSVRSKPTRTTIPWR